MSHSNANQMVVDNQISKLLKHAPEKPGCHRYKVSYFNYIRLIRILEIN